MCFIYDYGMCDFFYVLSLLNNCRSILPLLIQVDRRVFNDWFLMLWCPISSEYLYACIQLYTLHRVFDLILRVFVFPQFSNYRIVDITGVATATSKKTIPKYSVTVLSQIDIISTSINPEFGMHSSDALTDSSSGRK